MSEPQIKRIMVALDSSQQSQAALKAAAQLAARLNVELLGLFVEDINLLQLASLPFAREVVYASETQRSLASVDMERSLRAQADRLRQTVENAASSAQVHWSFKVYRGVVTTELLSVGGEGDLLVLGKIVKRSKPKY